MNLTPLSTIPPVEGRRNPVADDENFLIQEALQAISQIAEGQKDATENLLKIEFLLPQITKSKQELNRQLLSTDYLARIGNVLYMLETGLQSRLNTLRQDESHVSESVLSQLQYENKYLKLYQSVAFELATCCCSTSSEDPRVVIDAALDSIKEIATSPELSLENIFAAHCGFSIVKAYGLEQEFRVALSKSSYVDAIETVCAQAMKNINKAWDRVHRSRDYRMAITTRLTCEQENLLRKTALLDALLFGSNIKN